MSIVADASPSDLAERGEWFGHPRPLSRLFMVELWERFGFYGMRALLVLYLTKHFVFPDETAGAMYGAYMSLCYLTPVVGGLIADRLIGAKRSVKFGAVVMAIGYLVLCFGGQQARSYAEFGGTRHAVEIAHGADGKDQRFVEDGADRLQIAGQDNGSVQLKRADGTVARTLSKSEFHTGAERSPMFVAVMLAALSLIVIGNGFFKPNVSTMVGELYAPGDQRRDGGFSIFYMGINLGAIFSQLLTQPLADRYGWWAGFALPAAGMLVSYLTVQFSGRPLAGVGNPPPEGRAGTGTMLLIALGTAVAVGVAYLLFANTLGADEGAPGGQGIIAYLLGLPVLGKLLFATFIAALIGIPIWSARAGDKTERDMMWAAMTLILFNTVFWTLFEQAGSSLTLFADRNTDRSIFGLFTISAGQTQFFNSAMVVLLAPVFTGLWAALRRRGLEPGIPVKFAFGIIGVGLGYLVLVFGSRFAGPDFRVSIWWLALLYLVHTAAELSISPVGLSMITKLSIARVVGMMMGMWFLSIAVAEYVGGIVAQFASVATVGGEVTNLAVSLNTYTQTFRQIGIAAVIAGLVLLVIAVPLRRWMHGIK